MVLMLVARDVDAARICAASEVEAFKTAVLVFELTLAGMVARSDVDAVVILAAVDAVPAVIAAAILVEATVVFALIAV